LRIKALQYQYPTTGTEAWSPIPAVGTTPAISNFSEFLFFTIQAANRFFDSSIQLGHLIMPDRFMSAVLAVLNESAEVKEADWHSIEALLRGSVAVDTAGPQVSENRFAATICSGIAKVRSGR
jgi:hypothetical protein